MGEKTGAAPFVGLRSTTHDRLAMCRRVRVGFSAPMNAVGVPMSIPSLVAELRELRAQAEARLVVFS